MNGGTPGSSTVIRRSRPTFTVDEEAVDDLAVGLEDLHEIVLREVSRHIL